MKELEEFHALAMEHKISYALIVGPCEGSLLRFKQGVLGFDFTSVERTYFSPSYGYGEVQHLIGKALIELRGMVNANHG